MEPPSRHVLVYPSVLLTNELDIVHQIRQRILSYAFHVSLFCEHTESTWVELDDMDTRLDLVTCKAKAKETEEQDQEPILLTYLMLPVHPPAHLSCALLIKSLLHLLQSVHVLCQQGIIYHVPFFCQAETSLETSLETSPLVWQQDIPLLADWSTSLLVDGCPRVTPQQVLTHVYSEVDPELDPLLDPHLPIELRLLSNRLRQQQHQHQQQQQVEYIGQDIDRDMTMDQLLSLCVSLAPTWIVMQLCRWTLDQLAARSLPCHASWIALLTQTASRHQSIHERRTASELIQQMTASLTNPPSHPLRHHR